MFVYLPVVQSAYETFLGQLKISIFWEKKISIFEKKNFQKSKFFFQKKSKIWIGPKIFYRPIWPVEDPQIANFPFFGLLGHLNHRQALHNRHMGVRIGEYSIVC